jgi:hypothetical protein
MSIAAKLYLLGALTLSIAAADSLTVVNANFANVAVQCSNGIAAQSYMGGTCAGPGNEQQDFNAAVGVGWTFASFPADANPSAHDGDGMTNPNTIFDPPSFAGLPFSRAAFLQGANTAIAQTITGFFPGGLYTLGFYLGSRYATGSFDGNQTVEAIVDSQVIGTWALTSYTPFTLQTIPFTVSTGGSHIIKFEGTVSGDHTAFLSGVSIATTGGLAVTPTTGEPGIGLVASAGGFAPLETVTLTAYASGPTVIGTATANTSGIAAFQGHVPQTPFGALGFVAAGQSSGTFRSGVMSLRPRLSVSPPNGTAGSTLTVTGFGFAAGEQVNLQWSNPQTLLGNATANKNGTFSAEVIIPTGAAAGTDRLSATGQRTGAAASTPVTVP